MKIRMVSQAFTQLGAFERGQKLTSGGKFSEAFLLHLVNDCGAAEIIEAKIIQLVAENKAITNASIPAKKKRGRPRIRS